MKKKSEKAKKLEKAKKPEKAKKLEKAKKPEKAKKLRKEKIEDAVAMPDLPKHLRSLAEMIEKGRVPLSDNVAIASISSLKLIFKYKDYRNIVRTRIYFEYPGEIDEQRSADVRSETVFIDKKGTKKKPALKKLKKKMDKAFAEIAAACDAGSLPDGKLVAAFYEDSEILALHESGKSPYLEESLEAARVLTEAVRDSSVQQARGAVEKLRYIRSESGPTDSGDGNNTGTR